MCNYHITRINWKAAEVSKLRFRLPFWYFVSYSKTGVKRAARPSQLSRRVKQNHLAMSNRLTSTFLLLVPFNVFIHSAHNITHKSKHQRCCKHHHQPFYKTNISRCKPNGAGCQNQFLSNDITGIPMKMD